jgi:hypothetical protein
MPLFGRRRAASKPAAQEPESRFAGVATARGLEPVQSAALDSQLQDAIHESARVIYGDTPRPIDEKYPHPTVYHDLFRTQVDGRTVIVANGWTTIKPGLEESARDVKGVAACVVELPSILAIACVQPRRFRAITSMLPENPTGNAQFDELFSVTGSPVLGPVVVTPDMQRLIMARDDWLFLTHQYLLACVGKGAFESVDEMLERVDEVLAIVAAIPESVMPSHVDHSQDDLIARISQLDTLEDAMALLQELTPADREQLARSDTPLAAFADVATPEEAIARFESLDQQRKMQVLAMFMRVDND